MTKDESVSPLEPAKQTVLESLFANLPEDYEDRQAMLERLRDAFHQQVVIALQDRFWKQVRSQSQKTRDDRLSLTTAMRERLERLGLSLADPAMGRRGVLVIHDTQPPTQGEGRYLFRFHDDSGEQLPATEFEELPELEIVARSPLLKKPFYQWPGSLRPKSPGR